MIRIVNLFLAISFLAVPVHAELPAQLNIGDAAPNLDQAMADVSGEMISLEMVTGEHGLLVVFTCNTCPYVLAWEDRYDDIAKWCNDNQVGLIMVNPNEARRATSDSYEAMQAHADEKSFTFPYVLDERHRLADAFGATKTPDVFLFNNELKLVYKGAIDDNYKNAESVEEHFLSDAIQNLVSGKEIDPNATRAIGCSIKRLK